MASAPQIYRVYLHNWTGVASATNPSFLVVTGTNKIIEIIRLKITQNNSTTTGQAEWDLNTGTSTPTGSLTQTNVNYAKLNGSDPTPGFTLKDGNFTSAAGGLVPVARSGFNVLSGDLYYPVPEERIVVRPADGFLQFRLLATPASTNYDIEMILAEKG